FIVLRTRSPCAPLCPYTTLFRSARRYRRRAVRSSRHHGAVRRRDAAGHGRAGAGARAARVGGRPDRRRGGAGRRRRPGADGPQETPVSHPRRPGGHGGQRPRRHRRGEGRSAPMNGSHRKPESNSAASTSEEKPTTAELKDDIERTRADLADTVEALAYKADVPSRMKDRARETSETVRQRTQQVTEQAMEKLPSP